jgi:hypothetical protein
VAEPEPLAEPAPEPELVETAAEVLPVEEPVPETEAEALPDEDAEAEEDIEDEQTQDGDEDLTLTEGPDLALDRLSRMERPVEAATDRAPRPSLFGSRKPAPPAPTATKPVERAGRPGEPITRVRAPAPRPAVEPPRPANLAPEDLASPRLVPQRERMAEAEAPDPALARTERRERPRIAARAVVSTPAPTGPAQVSSVASGEASAAVTLVIARAADLVAQIDPEAKVPVDLVLEHCRDTIDRLIEVLAPAKSADLQRIRGDLGEVQDLIMLMQLEKGHAPADDAITLLLQIRRDLETLSAA